ETETAGTMAGDFQNLEVRTEKTSVWCFLDQKIWFDRFDFQREPEVPKKIAIGNHRPGKRVTYDLAVKVLFNPGNVLNLINVPVFYQKNVGIDIDKTDPFTPPLRCLEQDPSFRCFKKIAIG